jgi:protein-S-isoprenylcysteine O-methyltransferase Ste14
VERAITVLLITLAGLGIGLALAGRRRSTGSEPGEEDRPWRAVSQQAIAGVFTVASLLALAVLAFAGPILAIAVGILLFEVAVLVLQALRSRREQQIHDEAMILVDTLVTETTLGTPLPDALRGYVQRHPQAHGSTGLTTGLAGEIHRFVLTPLVSGESLVTLLNRLVEGPRYVPYPTFHRLLLQLARAVRGRLTLEETEHSLRAFLDTAEMVDEVQRELAVDVTQTRYSRWTVVVIIAGGILFMAFVMPDARQHWLHDLVGQVTMLLVSLFIALAVGLGERLSRMKGWRF